MAAVIPSPPSVDQKNDLIARLDTLLEQYLHTLDSYEQLTQQLSQQFSSVTLPPLPPSSTSISLGSAHSQCSALLVQRTLGAVYSRFSALSVQRTLGSV